MYKRQEKKTSSRGANIPCRKARVNCRKASILRRKADWYRRRRDGRTVPAGGTACLGFPLTDVYKRQVLTGTDLSAGRIVGLTAGLSAALLQGTAAANKYFENLGEPGLGMVLLTLLLVLIIGGFVGMVNGFFVARFQLHPFIVTLATQLIVYRCV